MCDRFRGIREEPYSLARSWERENPLQDVCMLQMGVFVKESGSYRPTTCTVCSEFPAAQTG